jgi:hypothetical protein
MSSWPHLGTQPVAASAAGINRGGETHPGAPVLPKNRGRSMFENHVLGPDVDGDGDVVRAMKGRRMTEAEQAAHRAGVGEGQI